MLAFVAALLVAATAVRHVAAAQETIARELPLRIMALGDSITAGVGANGAKGQDGGYRGALAALLARRGYHPIFVGSRVDYSATIDQRAHEGWPGYVLRSFPSDPGPGQLYGPLTHRAILANRPDVILLMAGTNDLLRLAAGRPGYTLPNVEHSLHLEIDQILTEAPRVHLIVAPVVASPRIKPCVRARFAGMPECGIRDDESMANLVERYAQHGYNVTLATEMSDAVAADPQHFPDGIHPSGAGGYRAIAQAWCDAILAITQPVAPPVAENAAAR